MKTFVYLAGPIAGCTKDQANDWRDYVKAELPDGIVGVSPLRCEPIIGDIYELGYQDPKFGLAKAIAGKNEFDTKKCDIVLAYLPKVLNDQRPSIGTIIEMAWAHMLGKTVILVTDDPYYQQHPLVQQVASWPPLATLDDAIDVLSGVLSIYAEAA